MSVEGHIQVAIDFNDVAEGDGLDTLKKVRLASSDSFSTNKISVVTGTCGTAASTFSFTQLGYFGADGEEVTYTTERTVDGVAFQAEPYATLTLETTAACPITPQGKSFKIASADNRVAMTQIGKKSGTTLGGLTLKVFVEPVDSARTATAATYAIAVWGY